MHRVTTKANGRSEHDRLVDLRLYRLAFIPAAIALAITMFSLEGVPDPIEPLTPTGTFDGDAAGGTAREIVRLAPERGPGTTGDAQIADLVAERFSDIPAGAVSEVPVEVDLGDPVTVRNVLLTLPGNPNRTILIVAGRDAERGSGAASSAAATGVLIELAEALGVAGHDSTYVLASTSGGEGGARALLDALPGRDSVDEVIVIAQPGAAEPSQPHALITSTSSGSGPIQLRLTAERAIETQTGIEPAGASGFAQLARLAFPSGLGAQAPLIAGGYDAVAVSSAGERPLAEDEDLPESVSRESIDSFGRSVHALAGAVDSAPPLDRGPSVYIEVSGNLIPGWALSALALALILPGLLAAVDACARAARRGGAVPRSFAWAAARAAPFVGALALLYALALVGLIPRPEFPFDPGGFPSGARAWTAFALITILFGATAFLLRRFGVTGRAAPPGAVPAVGALAVGAAAVLWIANPYCALLAVPAAHVWVLADGGGAGAVRRAIVIVAALIALIPLLAALLSISGALELGGDAPWILTLMVADGQIGLATMLTGAVLAGALLATVALALSAGGRLPAQPHGQPA